MKTLWREDIFPILIHGVIAATIATAAWGLEFLAKYLSAPEISGMLLRGTITLSFVYFVLVVLIKMGSRLAKVIYLGGLALVRGRH